MKVCAAVLDAPGQRFQLLDAELDPPKSGEVLVRVIACGVCHSDWHLVTGDTKHPMPVVAGHEGAGVVEAIGEGVDAVKVGDHVVLSWAPSCGECYYCRHRKPNLCDTYTDAIWAGTMLDGTTRLHRGGERIFSYCGTASFAEFTVVPQASCVVIRSDVMLDAACLVGCAVATGVGAALYTARVQPRESVVVIGCGGVGLNIIQGARLCEAGQIIAVDTRAEKKPLAMQLGATDFVVAGENLLNDIRSRTGGRGADHAFEAIGIPSVQEQALDLIRPGGTLTLAGLSPMGSPTSFPSAVIARQEKTIKGSYYGSVNPATDFPMLLDHYVGGKLKLDELISRRYRLEQINDAFEAMQSGQAARGVIVL